jgi:hypothetical protein
MGLAELKADYKLTCDHYAGMPADAPITVGELRDNILPLVGAKIEVAEQTAARLDDHDDALDELTEGAGDLLFPETAEELKATLEQGRALANFLEKGLVKFNDLERKKAKELIKTFRTNCQVAIDRIDEMTLEDEEDDEDDEDDDLDDAEEA